jgi:hypothetical protein
VSVDAAGTIGSVLTSPHPPVMYPTVAHILPEDFTCDSCYYNHKTRAKRVTCADHGHTATQGLVAQGLVDHVPDRGTYPSGRLHLRQLLLQPQDEGQACYLCGPRTHGYSRTCCSRTCRSSFWYRLPRAEDFTCDSGYYSHRKTAWRTYRRRVFRDVLSNTRQQHTSLRTPRHFTPQQPSPMYDRWAWAG